MAAVTEIAFELAGEEMVVHHERVLWWPARKALLLADLHLGKIAHFRSRGIAVPRWAASRNYDRLSAVVARFQPDELIILGDLFHSDHNPAWETFRDWRKEYASKAVHLVVGNHDILSMEDYRRCDLTLYPLSWQCGPFFFTHDPEDRKGNEDKGYHLCGHIHPGVRLRGPGRQGIKLPCFWFGKEQGILPAFGEFTGRHALKISKGDQVFGLTDDEVIAL